MPTGTGQRIQILRTRRANGDPRRLFRGETGNKDRVKKQVEAGKLIIGPWYTQTDTTIVSAESIVRNLMYGMRTASRLASR